MDTPSHNLEELVERYLQDKMSLAEREEFEKKVQSDPSLKQIVQEEKASQLLLDAYENRSLKNLVDGLSDTKLREEKLAVNRERQNLIDPKEEFSRNSYVGNLGKAKRQVDEKYVYSYPKTGGTFGHENQLKKIWKRYPPKLIGEVKSQISEENIYELLGSIFCPGPFYFFIFDFLSYELTYVNRKVEEVLGYKPKEVNSSFFIKHIVQEDVDHLANCEKTAGNFFFSFLPRHLVPSYKVSYCFRMIDANKNEKQILHQSFILGMDEKGNILNSLIIHSDITHLGMPLSQTISFRSLNEEKHYIGLNPNSDSFLDVGIPSPLSSRETEILRLFAEGDSDKDISKKFHLSVHAIHMYRNNIRSKLKCRNTAQAVAMAIRNGWI